MPIKIGLDESRDLLSATLTGLAGVEEITMAFAEAFRDPTYRPGMNALVDMTAYEHQNTSEGARAIADFLVNSPNTSAGGKVGIVVSKVVSYGMIRMLQAFLERTPLEVSVFYELDEAKGWLGLA
jgi:hypothetical protein